MARLKWPLIAILASTGFLFGGATIMGWIAGWEHVIALIFIIGVGKMAAFFAPAAPRSNAFVAGFLMALVAVWTQGVFLRTYFENNPDYAATDIPLGLSAQAWTFLAAPVGALFAGALAVLSAIVFAFLFKRFWPRGSRHA
ncbi:MAG: hypothetical protein AAFW81_00515 [Pseudomonadota bacterium]